MVYNHVKAGHEIKTPLTIINANVDLLELDEEKEELTEIRQQTKHLTELTNDLVLLSKMEEPGHTLQKIDFPLSDLLSETAASFRAPAAEKDIALDIHVEPDITLNGSPDSVRQLISLLLDNSVKYAPSDSTITLSLTTHRKTAVRDRRTRYRSVHRKGDNTGARRQHLCIDKRRYGFQYNGQTADVKPNINISGAATFLVRQPHYKQHF